MTQLKNYESDYNICPSLYPTNPICIISFFDDNREFKIIPFDCKTFEEKKTGVIKKESLYSIKIFQKIINVAAGEEENQLIFFLEDGSIYSIDFIIENEEKILFSNWEFLMKITKPEIFFKSTNFIPLFSKNIFIGIALSNESHEEFENTFIFLKEDNLEIRLNSVFIKFFPNEFDKISYFLAVDCKSIILFQFQPHNFKNITEVSIIIPLEINQDLNIIEAFYNNNIISLWSKDKISRYSVNYGLFINMKSIKPISTVIQTPNPKIFITISQNKLNLYNIILNNFFDLTLLNSDFSVFSLQFDNYRDYYIYFPGYFFEIVDNSNNYRFKFFKDQLITYIVRKSKRVDTLSFFDTLKQCSKEIQQVFQKSMSKFIFQLENNLAVIEEQNNRKFTPRKYFTKEIDLQILDKLYSNETYNYEYFAEKFNLNRMSIIIHVKNSFDIPKCGIHQKFHHYCSDCQENLIIWRDSGKKLVDSKKYRKKVETTVPIHWRNKTRHIFKYRRQSIIIMELLLDLHKKLNLNEKVLDDTINYLSICIQKDLFKGRTFNNIVGCCLFISAKNNKTPIIFDEIYDIIQLDSKSFKRTLKAIIQNTKLKIKPANPIDYIEKFIFKLKLSENLTIDLINKSTKLLKEYKGKKQNFGGKDVKGYAAAAIYLVAKYDLLKKIPQTKIAYVFTITEVTLRNRMRDFKKVFSKRFE